MLTVPMKAHEMTAGFIYGYSIGVHIASDAQTGASRQPPFSLNVDTGSAKLYVSAWRTACREPASPSPVCANASLSIQMGDIRSG